MKNKVKQKYKMTVKIQKSRVIRKGFLENIRFGVTFGWKVYYFAVKKYHRLGDLNNRNLFSHSC